MPNFSQNVNAGARDGYQSDSFGFNAGANQLYIGAGGGGYQDSFIRFTNVTIPAGATITTATLNLTRDSAGVGTVNWLCDCIDADNQADITTGAQYNGLSHTTANTTGSSSNPATLAITFTSALQEVIDRGGWSSGNAFVVCVRNNGSSGGSLLSFASYENTSFAEPNVSIDYTSSTNYSDTATGGIVFGGTATVEYGRTNTGDGGIEFGGEATLEQGYVETAEGGILFAGDAEDIVGTAYTETATGGIVFSGDATTLASYNHTATGGIVFGGQALTYNAFEDTATGGIVFGGEAGAEKGVYDTATGGIVFGGEAGLNTGVSDTATGGIVFGGEATANLGYGNTAEGGIVFGGAATDSVATPADLGCCQTDYSETSTGGIVFGGSATINSSSHTATGGIRFGGSATVSTNQTYDDFEAVYHLDEQGNGTAGEFEDSTAHSYDAQGGGGFEIRTPTRTQGLFSAANYFDGNEFIQAPEFRLKDTTPVTITLWAKRENQFLRRTFYSIGKTDILTPEGWQIRLGHTEVGKPTAAVQVEAGDDWAIYTATGDDVLTDDCWHHLAAVWEPGVGLSLYVDGELVAFTEVEETSLVPATSGSYIGRVDNTQYAQAKLQEVRIAPLVREVEWLLADHEAICDTEFYSVGEIMTPVYNLGE